MREIKRTRDGRIVEAETVVAYGRAHLEIYVAGQHIGHAGRNQLQTRRAPAGMYGVLYCMGRKRVGVALTRNEYDAVDRILAEAEAQAAQTPEAERERLRNERADLVARWQGARDDMEAAFERLHARGNTDEAFAARAEAEAMVDAASHAVHEWDAAHPEFTAERQRERDEAANRRMWD